jgi:hypothetical protein
MVDPAPGDKRFLGCLSQQLNLGGDLLGQLLLGRYQHLSLGVGPGFLPSGFILGLASLALGFGLGLLGLADFAVLLGPEPGRFLSFGPFLGPAGFLQLGHVAVQQTQDPFVFLADRAADKFGGLGDRLDNGVEWLFCGAARGFDLVEQTFQPTSGVFRLGEGFVVFNRDNRAGLGQEGLGPFAVFRIYPDLD